MEFKATPEPEQEELNDLESGTEFIEISDLKRRMWKDHMLQMLRNKLEGCATVGPSSSSSDELDSPAPKEEENPEVRKAMGDVGFKPKVVSILRAVKSSEAKEMTVKALYGVVFVHRNRRRVIHDD
ncbi:unnamed protein product [Urochloa humidicola]